MGYNEEIQKRVLKDTVIVSSVDVKAEESLERAVAEELKIADPEPEKAEAVLKENKKEGEDATR